MQEDCSLLINSRRKLRLVALAGALTLVGVSAHAQAIYFWHDAEGNHYTDNLDSVPPAFRAAAQRQAKEIDEQIQSTTANPSTSAGQKVPGTSASTSASPSQKVPGTVEKDSFAGAPPPPLPSADSAPTPRFPKALPPPTPSSRDILYGQYVESEWRQRFIDAYRRIETLKASIASLTSSLPPRVECIPQPMVPLAPAPMPPDRGAPERIEASSAGAPSSSPNQTRHETSQAADRSTDHRPPPPLVPVARCQVNELYDRIQLEIARTKVELADAERDLDQLDRQASLDAVPREWRRGW